MFLIQCSVNYGKENERMLDARCGKGLEQENNF